MNTILGTPFSGKAVDKAVAKLAQKSDQGLVGKAEDVEDIEDEDDAAARCQAVLTIKYCQGLTSWFYWLWDTPGAAGTGSEWGRAGGYDT